jgi:hypothetical protein
MREDAAVGLELPVAVALDTEKYNAAESFLSSCWVSSDSVKPSANNLCYLDKIRIIVTNKPLCMYGVTPTQLEL